MKPGPDLILEATIAPMAGKGATGNGRMALVDAPRRGEPNAATGFSWRPTLLVVALAAIFMLAYGVLGS